MKFKSFVVNKTEIANQILESMIKGMDNKTINPTELYQLLNRAKKELELALERLTLEYES